MRIPIVRLDKDLPLPVYGNPGDAGIDLLSAVTTDISPGGTTIIPTGIKVAIPEGYVGLIHPRSGLSAKTPLRIANAPGTLDSGYRGEVGIIVHNTGNSLQSLKKGDRIAQLVVQEYIPIEWDEVEELPTSVRGEGGYGSTGGFTK